MKLYRTIGFALTLACAASGVGFVALAADAPQTDDSASQSDARPLQRLAEQLPPAISDGLDVEGWVWLADSQNNFHPRHNFYDAVFSLSLTKSFDQRVAITAQGLFIDANGSRRADLEQGYISAKLFDQTILTIGIFNANFGIEPRDFWNRRTGTTGLLFAAQPQDLIGAMVTQPLGDSGITLRPFISADFQGAYMFDQPPSAGLMVEYKPNNQFTFAVTNWVGPGLVRYEGKPLRPPFDGESYGDEGDGVTANWQGPNLYAERGGTMHFVEAKAVWYPMPELMLGAEYIFARTSVSEDDYGWQGWMFLADYQFNDRLHVFGRYSYLNDDDWFVTEIVQRCQEVSCGFGYQLFNDVEFRAEYRHDFSNHTPDFDTVSVHLTFAF